MPYTPENYHLIGAAELQLMKPSAMLFNIARGGLIASNWPNSLHRAGKRGTQVVLGANPGLMAGTRVSITMREPVS